MGPNDPLMSTMTGTISQIPVATLEPPRRQDGAFLHFLKELPAQYVLVALILIFLGMFQMTQNDFIPRIIDSLIASVLTVLVTTRRQATATIAPPSTTNIDTDTAAIDSKETTINVQKRD